MVVSYAVTRPRGLQGYTLKKCREWQDERTPEYTYDYRLYKPDGSEVPYFVKSGSARLYLMVSVTCSTGQKLVAPLHKIFAFNSSVCNPGPRPHSWCSSGALEVHHGGRLTAGRNCRESNMKVQTKGGHRIAHRA